MTGKQQNKKGAKTPRKAAPAAPKKAVSRAPKKGIEKEYAKMLYLSYDLSIKEIAARAGVSENSLSKWIVEGMWESRKKSLLTSKKDQLFRLYEILSSLTTKIEETKFGDTKLADMMIKYTAAVNNLETETNMAQVFEVMMAFNSWLLNNDAEMAKTMIDLADTFIMEKMRTA